MARTQTTPHTPPAPPPPPPDPPTEEVARPSPVLAWPPEWPMPEPPEPQRRRPARGLPMGPVLAGAGNSTTMAATAAYSAGGPAAAAATGVVVAAGAAVAVLRRRATVRRSVAARTGGAPTPARVRGSSGLPWRGGAGSSGGRRSATGGRSAAGSGRRSGSTSEGGGRSKSALRSRGRGSGSRSGLLRTRPGRHTTSAGGRRRAAPAAGAPGALKPRTRSATTAKHPKTTATPGRAHTLTAAVARTARAARTASRPHTARAAKAARRHAKTTGAALLDGAIALSAAAWTWARTRDKGAALDRLKNVWRRRRTKRTTTPDTPARPDVAATVRRPTAPTAPSTGGTTMSGGGHHFVAPAMELARAAAAYQPNGMLQVGADFSGLEEALRLHAEAMKVTVENADAHFPLHPNIVELMRQIHGLQLKAAELAAELTPAFRQLHDTDIARLENPRKGTAGERMWDVSTNL